MFLDQSDRSAGIDVAGNDDSHVAGNIILPVKLVHVLQRRVLEMLHLADGGLLAVGMSLEEQFVNRELNDRLLVVECLVLFLVNYLQLRLKKAKDGMLEPLGFDDRPLLQPVPGQVHLINGLFVPRVGVEPLFTHRLIELVHLVGNLELRGLLRFPIDLGVDGFAFLGIGFVEMFLVKLDDEVEVRLLLLVIEGAEARRALEQHVFEVVREAGGLGGVLFAAGAHGDLRLEPRCLVVLRQINRQAVFQLVNLHRHRVPGIWLTDPFETGRRGNRCGHEDDRQGDEQNGFAIRRDGLADRVHWN